MTNASSKRLPPESGRRAVTKLAGIRRRSFCGIIAAEAAALGLGGVGCRGLGHEDGCVRAAVGKYIGEGLYAGLACVSNHCDLHVDGVRTLGEPKLPVTSGTLFDLASVGKTQTASLCALLYADGRLDVDAPFTEYLSEHVLAKENCRITVRDLATHSGGFDNSKPYMLPDGRKMFDELYRKRPVWPRRKRFCYACSNFVYLGLIAERLVGMDLDAAAKKMLWGPLGMERTTWKTVVGDQDVAEYQQSTYGGPKRKIGERNDICAHLAPCPMGNGANFSTALDMQLFVDDLLRREHFPKAYYDLLFTPSFAGDGHRRSFGWDMTAAKSTFSDWAPTGFSAHAICHTGWTGGAIAVDPDRNFAGVVLGNRLASKERTMGPRLHLLDLMAAKGC